MARSLPRSQRRQPLAVLIDPATRARLTAITTATDGHWSQGAIVDRAIAIAEADLIAEAEDRQVVIVAFSARTERNLGLIP